MDDKNITTREDMGNGCLGDHKFFPCCGRTIPEFICPHSWGPNGFPHFFCWQHPLLRKNWKQNVAQNIFKTILFNA